MLMRKIALIILFWSGLCAGTVNNLHLSDKGFLVENLAIQKGGMTLTLQEGEAAPIRYQDITVGFLFVGKAHLSQSVTERFARQVLDYNLKHASHQDLTEDGTIEDNIIAVSVLGTAAAKRIPLELGPIGKMEKAMKTMDDLFFSQEYSQPISWVLGGVMEGSDELALLIDGAKDDYIYEYDPLWRGEETLYVLKNSSNKRKGLSNYYWLRPVVSQTLRKDRRIPHTSPAVLTSLEYDLDFSDLENMSAVFRETIQISKPCRKVLRLGLWNTSVRSKGTGTIVQHLFIDKVLSEEGDELDYIHDGDYLTIILPKSVKAGETLSLSVHCHGNLFEPSVAIGSYIIISGIDWFPNLTSGAYGVNALFSGRITTTLPLKAFASVNQWIAEEKDGMYTFRGESTHPCFLHSLVIGKYYPHTFKVGDVKVTVASLIFENKRAYKILKNLTESTMEVYRHFLGDFPFESLLIIEAKGLGWGQAPPGMIFASGEIFNSMKDELTQLYSEGANERFAHEMAHQYYGHVVHSMSTEESWLIEAVAEYMAGVFLSKTRRKSDLKQMYNHWYARAKDATDHASIYSLHLLTGDNSGRYQHALVYAKGPVVIHALREELGFKTFWTVLRSFLKSFPRQKVTTEDFIGLINHITKEDRHRFFDLYVYGKRMPKKSKHF